VGADVAIAPRLRLLGSAAWERGQFNQVDPSFLVERRDVFTNYEAVLAYALNDRASLRFGVTLTNQRSNIVIYEYDRTEGWMMLRFDFP
jgi:hypothetical protein